MDAQTLLFVFAAVMFISVAAFGYIPLTLELSSKNLKQFTAIGAGVLIASAFLVVIPEALELFDKHEDEDSKIAISSIYILSYMIHTLYIYISYTKYTFI